MVEEARKRVVLLDADGRPCGEMDKALVHTRTTPLHLAFSLYAFDGDGRLLVTRRAVSKATFPGVWTNTCCGHPAPGEAAVAAARRRTHEELGLEVGEPAIALPDFRYTATCTSGLVENELCPVLVARADSAIPLRPDPAEVVAHRWVAWEDYRRAARTCPWLLSPWSALQVAALDERGIDPPALLDGLTPPA